MFVQDWVLGLAAIALYPIQAWLIPKLQRKLNQLKKKRVVLVRKLSERIGEVVNGVQEIHAHDTSQLECDFSERLGGIYEVRYQIYKQKFFIKFLNNFIAQITPFFFYSIGGYLVITGDLTLGALVAALAAYKDLSAPWKELLNYYQILEDARIKYDLLMETFRPDGLMEPAEEGGATVTGPFGGEFVLPTSTCAKRPMLHLCRAHPSRSPSHRSWLSLAGGSGARRLATIVAGLNQPLSGAVSVDGHDVSALPETVTGRRFASARSRARDQEPSQTTC